MRLRTALNDYKRDRSDPARYPGERQTVEGAFSGHGDRLVHVDPNGSLRDFSAPLSELYGIDRSRLGIRTETDTYWFDDLDTIRQHYYRETNLVETEYDMGEFTVHQYDLTLGRAHVTHVELRGAIPSQAHLVAFMTLAPEGQEARVARLIHEDGGPSGSKAVEVFHHHEHDYVTASTGLDEVHGQVPEQFDEILDDEALTFPRDVASRRYEDTHLSGDILVTAPLEQTGRAARTSLVTQLSDHDEIDREDALADLRHCVSAHETSDDLRAAARDRTSVSVPEESPRPSLVRTDLRVLDLLLAPTGAHISAPDFDPFYVNSGGYGYCWFGEDATIASNLLAVDDSVGLDTADRLRQKAAFYCAGQLPDGTWPHRVWASDGELAPGWANARVEHDETSGEYQAHQSAQVTTFLARYLRTRGDDVSETLRSEIRETLEDAVAAMDDSLDQNGLPELCQNLWEDAMGQFTHTAARYIEAYAEVGRAPVGEGLQSTAAVRAEQLFASLDELWDDSAGSFAQRLDGNGIPDRRLDASTFALVDAFRAYASLDEVTLSEADLDRLTSHVGSLLNGLYRNPPGNPVGGLVRFEGDRWRTMDQPAEKIWTLTTAMGAAAAAELGVLLEGYGRNGEAFFKRGSDLYNLLRADGPLTSEVGYLAAQVFDDGTLDGATPLGTAHVFRLRATTILGEQNALPTAPAPTGPEERLRWTTGEKYGLGTVADHGSPDPSRVWFTLTEGALTEARFPRIDLMNLRTLDFLVRCRDEEYVVRTHKENRRRSGTDTVDRRVEPTADDALLFKHVITEQSDGHGHEWSLTVEYAADPEHDAIVADVQFEAHDGKSYDVFAVADTALSTTGEGERGLRLSGSTGHHLVARAAAAYTQSPSPPLLVDENDEGYSVALALAAEQRFDWATVGVAGDEHLQAVFSEDALPEGRDTVESDHVVLVGRLGSGTETDTRIALGFAGKADTAAALGEAEGALATGYDPIRTGYRDSWQSFLADKALPASVSDDQRLAAQYRSALMTLLAVEDKGYAGASVASPSVPWGEVVTASKSQGTGYNFVWSRDLYQVFTVFDAVDGLDRAIEHLEFIYEYQQQPDGFVPQNTYVNGETRWVGEQMDNVSFPQVMAYHLWERGVSFDDVAYDFENLRLSADYVAQNGPATSQERWEEEAGYSPSTIAAEIAGLVCAGTVAMDTGHEADALSWFALADQWTNVVESWTATETGTEKHDRTPYYVRVTRDGDPESGTKRALANDGPTLDERDIIDGGFLELVRLGIKPWDDRVVRNSIAEVDKTIRVDLDGNAAFYRYNGDGYGERERGDQGGPWSVDHNGKGRLWPLLTGERGEYELHADEHAPGDHPQELLESMASFANSGRMLAEQVWDRQYTTDYDWEPGEGTGAATPLAWAMAQFVRLAHGIDAGEPVETPAVVRERYLEREVHEQDRSPALRVDTRFRGDEIIFSGKTTGELVAVKTPVDSALVEPDGGEFEVGLEMEYGENTCIVAAASQRDLEQAGTTVSRITL